VKTTTLTALHELQSYLTLYFQLILWTERTKYYTQASHLVRPHYSFHFYTNTRIGHLSYNSRIFAKRLNFLWFLNLVFFYYVSFLKNFYYSCIISFTITSLFSLFLTLLIFPLPPVLQSIVLPPNYSFCPFSSTVFLVFTSPSYPPPICHILPLPPTHSPPAD
jgi:hypothetical protein